MAFPLCWRSATASFVLALSLAVTPAVADVATRALQRSFAPLTAIEVTGDITQDDVTRIETVLEEGLALRGQYGEITNFFEAHLDSPGGSFKAGIEIARLFNRYQVPTKIKAGSECLSACAVIFMSGYSAGYEGPNWRDRVVEWPAKLGFHRPFILTQDTSLTEGVIAQIDPKDLAEIFAEQFFTAFDQGNALIQEMLAVDSGAWSTELLLDMLTATSQGNNFAFVYLETVEDSLSWNIPVSGVVAAPRRTREDRFELALAACFHMGRRSDIGKIELWPVASDLQRHREYNLDRERRRPGSTFRDGGKVIDIRWYLWEGHEGCAVSFEGGTESVDIDGTRYPMPNGLMQWAPDVSLDRATNSVERPQACREEDSVPAQCVVMRGTAVTDNEPCLYAKALDSGGAPLHRFCWPSGSVTTLQERASGTLINGKVAQIVSPVLSGMSSCHLNTSSGNTFCFGQR